MAKKKGSGRGDDDEEEREEVEAAAAAQTATGKGKKKGKKGKGRDDFDDDFKIEPEEGQEADGADEDEGSAKGAVPAKPAAGLKKKKGKKGRGNDDSDEDSAVQAEEEEVESKQVGKKGKKGKKGRADDDFDEDFKVDAEEDASEAASIGAAAPKARGKKKDKKKERRAGDWSDEEEDEVVPPKKEAPPPKSKASAKKAASAFALLDIEDEDEEEEEEEEVQRPASNGKGTGRAGKKAVSFAALEEEESGEEEEEEAPKPSKKLNGFAGLSVEDEEEEVASSFHLVVGEIESVEKIKKADKLRVCHVDIGKDEPLQIVCGGKNVREGLKVVVAPIGSKIPSSGMVIQKTTIKGVDSFGMICGAGELGWEGPRDEAIELGDEAVVGEGAPLTRLPEKQSMGKRKGGAKVVETQEDLEEDEDLVAFAGKKKKGGKQAPRVEVYDEGESEDEAPVFSGKKKKGGRAAVKEEGEQEEENVSFGGKKKKGKKALQDDFEMEEPAQGEEPEAVVFGGKKKKKGGKKATQDDFEIEAEEPEPRPEEPEKEEESESLTFTGKKKKKGKKALQDETEMDEPAEKEEESEAVVFGGKKKKKGGKKATQDDYELEEDEPEAKPEEPEEDDETEGPTFAGKKKRKGKKALQDDFEMEAEEPEAKPEEPEEEEETEGLTFAGKKKKKGKKALQDDFDMEEPAEQEEESEAVVFGGKKKKKGAKKMPQDDFEMEAEGPEAKPEEPEEEEDNEGLAFAGKKKKGKKAAHEDFDKDFEVAVEEEESEPVVFKGKKKGKGGKKAAQDDFDKDFEMEEATEAPVPAPEQAVAEKKGKKGKEKKEDEDIEAILAQLEAPKKEEEEGGGSKKKKKKAKKGKDEKEEDDIDALLAELEGPPKKEEVQPTPSTEPAAEEAGPSQADEGDVAGGAPAAGEDKEGDEGLSAAAKKKKKKKEKEKEKKSADKAATVEDEGAKEEEAKKKKAAADKKLPLHVRQMQERLAKLQAEEERKKQEEEERRRKEEEEAARLAQLEREKEEAKLRKKQREKEKREQLKKEGKLLTGKQKEEAKRLAAVREQMLKQAGVKLDGGDNGEETAPKKQKVVYGTKKNRQPAKQAPGAALKEVSPEPEPIAEPEPMEEEAPEPEPVVEAAPATPEVKAPEPPAEEEEDDDDDWDAKSWDEAEVDKTLKKTGAFKDEEEPEKPSVKPTKKDEPAKLAKNDESAKPAPSRPAILHKAGPRKPQADESSEEESESETDSEDDSSEDEREERRAEARKKREARMKEAMAKRDENDLRSPICCILGHVDTGKTKLLDRIRNTNVQEGEAGGITQQIGATFFPMEAIKERTKELRADANLKVPGLLIIDTPGHESFTNLRSRGSGLCDIAILVVDIMHGLEPQTVESINLLKMRKTPFIIALNKVDRLYDWKVQPNAPIRNALKLQPEHVRNEFDRRAAEAVAMLQEQGLNSSLYWKNTDLRRVISIVPTSAISGEGIPDMLLLLVQMTQKMMSEKLMYLSETQCTVLEVKVIEGLGTTIDVVLVNGVLHEGDTIVVCGLQGPIKTTIRALLTPHPMKELRVKGSYVHHKELKAAQGIKITAQGLESAVAGTQLYVVGPDDDLDDIMEEAMQDMNSILSRVDKTGEGVCVQASTLGSLEALLEFLKSPEVNIPVSGINIGPIHKKDVMRASVMLERKRKEFACILAFDVKVTPEARDMAEELGVKVFTADIIYHLFDQFTAYMGNIKAEKRADAAEDAVFPCILKILPQFVFMKKDPIILGCDVMAGIAKVGTPICVPSKGNIDIGKIASIEMNHKAVDTAKKGQSIALKIQSTNAEEAQKMYGRHFDKDDELVSHISRKSIDLLKENYRDDLSREDWMLVVKLKKMFEIQ